MRIPNILHKSVPTGKDETENRVLRKFGDIKKFNFELKSHGEIIEKLKNPVLSEKNTVLQKKLA